MEFKVFWDIQKIKISRPDWGDEIAFVDSEACVHISDNLENLKSSTSEMKILVSENWNSEILKSEISIVSPTILTNPLFKNVFNRINQDKGSINLEEIIGEKLKKISNFKVMDIAVKGQYCDLLGDILVRNNCSHLRPTQWLNQVLVYLGYLEESSISMFPLDVDCAFTDQGYIVQLVVPVENFFKNYLLQAFDSEIDIENSFNNLLNGIQGLAHSTDFCYVESSKYLIITGTWIRGFSEKFGSVLFHQIPSYQKKEEREFKSLRIEMIKEQVLQGKIHLPGNSVELLELSQFEKSPHLLQIKKFVHFIKGQNLPEDKIVISEMPELFESFLKVSGGEKLNPQEMKLAFQALTNNDDLEELNMVVQSLESALPVGEEVNKVVDHLKNMNVDELIKVSGLACSPEERTVISSVTQNIKEDVWKVKRLEVSQKLEEQLAQKKIVTSLDVKDTLNQIFEESMGFQIPGLGIAMAEESLTKVQEKWSQASIQEIKASDRIAQLESALKMRNQMIGKMKSVVDDLKQVKTSLQEQNRSNENVLLDESIVVSNSGLISKSSEAELRILKDKLEFLQKNYNEMMETNARLDEQLKISQLELSRKTEELAQKSKDAGNSGISNLQLTIQSKNQLIDKLTNELRNFEDMNKALSLKVKSLEQRVKVMQSQIEGATQDLEADTAKVDSRFVQKIKQLESLYTNAQDENKKLMAELQARKAESHKYALENKTMKTKMHQLERQVANLSKKRAG
ncbi:MAG: hypothetical protein Fur0010_14950 [Bdellovibrio sp.]